MAKSSESKPTRARRRPASAPAADLSSLKRGEVVTFSSGRLSSRVIFVAGPDSAGMVVFERDGRYGLASSKCIGLVAPEATPAA